MLLCWIEAERFLSFRERARLNVGSGLTVVTGPNGAGKSNLGRCLDLARAVIGRPAGDPAADRLDFYDDAGYEGAGTFTVRIGIRLDQDWEHDLLKSFVCAAYSAGAPMGRSGPGHPSAEELDTIAQDWLKPDSLTPLWSGSLVIHHQVAKSRPWFAAWEFTQQGTTWHAVLTGDAMHQLRPGKADFPAQVGGSMPFNQWLMNSKPQDDTVLDFGLAMQQTDSSVTFSAGSGSSDAPESVLKLGALMGIDPANRSISFDQVMSVILQRGTVLTDNRRLPLQRRFGLGELDRPADLRDGAAVAGELFRLKNGYPAERARFARIVATFRDLTGRGLDVRARPMPLDGEDPGMLIEPTVTGAHGERLVEASGAGMQEALVLSVLLQDAAGKVVVLDEPAVNLEPTMQRRLTSKVRGPGQHIVITHSADLVPAEDPDDLERIVRVAPGPSGSTIRQPRFTGVATDELFRRLRLIEPTDVRGLLFARAVILCEGPTEVGALPRWWRDAPDVGLADPQAANIPVISVDGQGSYGAFIRYLDAFGVPWAIVADGPALRHNSKLASHLRRAERWSDKEPDDPDDFGRWREFWEDLGVFTLADQFGDDGSKGGEFEAYLGRVDPALLEEAEEVIGKKYKPRVGAYFAIRCPAPAEILDMYGRILRWLRIEG